jgi:hypothetical protein
MAFFLIFARLGSVICVASKTAVTMKDVVFWDVRSCGSSKISRRFGGTYRLHLQGNENLSLLSMQRGYASRRTAKKAPYNGTPIVVLIRLYRRGPTEEVALENEEKFHLHNLCRLNPTEWTPPEHGNRIQSPKRCFK